MTTSPEITDRAQKIRDYLNRDYRHCAAHEGADDYAWAAERGLATLLGAEEFLHAWAEPGAGGRYEREGTIQVLTAGHLLGAAYGPGIHGAASIEPLEHTSINVQATWKQNPISEREELAELVITLHRPNGPLEVAGQNHLAEVNRAEHLAGIVDVLKTTMGPRRD